MYEFITHTWNPIKGCCYHQCSYCYMNNLLTPKYKCSPVLVEYEFSKDLNEGTRIFVGSSIDMFAENVVFDPRIQQVKKMVEAGLFGEPYYAEGMYLHNIADLFVYPNGKTSWRSYWQCGTRGAFYPTHSLGPVMQWFTGDRVAEVSAFSPGVYNTLGLKQDSGTTVMCTTAAGKLITVRVDCMSPRPHNTDYFHLQGTKGCFSSKTHPDDYNRVSFIDEENGSPLHNMKDPDVHIDMPDPLSNCIARLHPFLLPALQPASLPSVQGPSKSYFDRRRRFCKRNIACREAIQGQLHLPR